MQTFFANPNVQHFARCADMTAFLANAVAVDVLRKLNVDARPAALAWLAAAYPAIHAVVLADYPQHTA
jgi:hypothetical protein